jgi:glycosyltransferase involved in cell wall biosynthesis
MSTLYNKVCIVAIEYMMPDGSQRRSLGGIQTYVDALKRLLQPICREVIIIQPSDVVFEIEDPSGVKVIGVPGHDRYYQKQLAGKCDMTICTHLPWAQWCSGPRLIGIQHGIGWDGFRPRAQGFERWIRKVRYQYFIMWKNRRMLRRTLTKLDKVICVDLNFPNWIRATYPTCNWEAKLRYIPNFGDPIEEAQLEAKLSKKKDHITVLIARRFEIIRGLPMMAQIVNEIYNDWPNARFIFAGWGSERERMRDILKGKERCEIVRLPPEEVTKANLEADIVAIPTMWSEGTSLSCIEGMCAGAAVLATSIGGLGNIILPGYNGLLVSPIYQEIRDGLQTLLGDAVLRKALARNGYETARTTFSRKVWCTRIMKVLSE